VIPKLVVNSLDDDAFDGLEDVMVAVGRHHLQQSLHDSAAVPVIRQLSHLRFDHPQQESEVLLGTAVLKHLLNNKVAKDIPQQRILHKN